MLEPLRIAFLGCGFITRVHSRNLRLLARGAIGELVCAHFVTIAKRLKTPGEWRTDETMAGGDAFFEEGIHWLPFANSLGPRIERIHGYRPRASTAGPDTRAKSMMVGFQYDNSAAAPPCYPREIPSPFTGTRVSTLLGRNGLKTFS